MTIIFNPAEGKRIDEVILLAEYKSKNDKADNAGFVIFF
jgi:hypothetical protein